MWGGGAGALDRRSAALVLGLGALLLLALTFRPIVQGDGVGYFVYLHGVLVNHQLDFTEEYAAATADNVNSDPPRLEAPTAAGHPANYFPIGPALLSAPAYAFAVALGGRDQFDHAPALVGAFTLTSLLCGMLALLLCWRLCGSVLAVVATALCTPFVFYLLYEPGYSHVFNAFAVSLFTFAWWRGRADRSLAGWLVLGGLAGLMTLTRWQDGLLAGIALLDLPRARWRTLLLLPGMAAALLPQLLVVHAIFGDWLPGRPEGQEPSLLAGHQLQVLFASRHGLFVWHPFTLLAAAGAFLVRDRALRAACVGALVIQTLVNGALPDWWAGAAFGARRFLDLLPFWAIGLAELARRARPALAWGATAAAAAWNVVLIANLQYLIRGEQDPGYLGLLTGQLAALRYLPRLVVQGAAVRAVALDRPADWPAAVAWLTAEAACLLVVVVFLLPAPSWGRARVGPVGAPLAVKDPPGA